MYTAPATVSTPALHACRVTLRQSSGREIFFGIVSPRTGRKLEVGRRFLAGWPRITGKIVAGISRGMVASFTIPELKAFAAAAAAQAQPCNVRYWGQRRTIRHRPAWR